MRRGIKARIDNNITNKSSKDNDGNLLQTFSCTSEYKLDEFRYIKARLESKYGIKFKDCYKRSQTVEEWDKIKDTLLVIKKNVPNKSIKVKVIKDDDWGKTSVSDLSPMEALARFKLLKAEEKRQRLLEEVKNVGLLIG